MCVTDRHDITLAVEVALNPNTTNHSTFNDPRKIHVENIVRKGENAGNQHFLLFQQCFVHVEQKSVI